MLKMMCLIFLLFPWTTQEGPDLEGDFKALSTYRFGDSRAPLQRIENRVLQVSLDPERSVDMARRIGAMLESDDFSLEGKHFLCRQLGLIGNAEVVPLLSTLLKEGDLVEDARYALERIPGEASLSALREALIHAKRGARVGLIEALGNRGDDASVETINLFLHSEDERIADAAVMALGKIGSPAALEKLLSMEEHPNPSAGADISHAVLGCAFLLKESGNKDQAALLFESLVDTVFPSSVRYASFSALLQLNEEKAVGWVMKAMREDDLILRSAALGYIQIHGKTEVLDALANRLVSFAEGMQVVVFRVLMERGYYDSEALGTMLESDLSDEVLGLAATKLLEDALGRLNNLALNATADSPDGLEMDGAASGDQAGIDGNPATYWDETDNQPLYQYKVSFDSPLVISALSIIGWRHHDFAPKDFEVLLDGVTVQTKRNAVYLDNRLWIFLSKTPCRTVELKITGYYGRSPAIRELEIFDLDESFPLELLMPASPSSNEMPIPMEEYAKIEKVAPDHARAVPGEKRKVLVFSRSWGYKHSAVPYGDAAIEVLARKTGAFEAVITKDASLFEKESLSRFDAVVFNNTNNEIFLPENYENLSGEEKAKAEEVDARLKQNLVEYLWQGGGLAVTHAGVASFRNWPEFGEIMGARFDNHPWSAGSQVALKVDDPQHPLAKAFVESSTLKITDEIYQLKGKLSREKVRVIVSLDMEKTKVTPEQRNLIHREDNDFPMTYVKCYGRGRIFYCAFGHEHELFWNPVILQHYLDGIQFTLGDLEGEITPSHVSDTPPDLSWHKGDYGLALLNQGRIVWQLNYDRKLGKAYMHPVSLLDGVPLTWLNPPDHLWHRALWFGWKFINNMNYWEISPEMGVTEFVSIQEELKDDFSARIEIVLDYHPPGGTPVMREKRSIHISPPDGEGCYAVDWEGDFTALEDLELNRTPPPDEPGGVDWGGYAGMSVRLAKETKDWLITDSEGRTGMECHRQPARWIACGFEQKSSDRKAVLAILDHPLNPRHPPPSFIVLREDLPFIYYSPALLFNEAMMLEAGKSMTLRYRIWVGPSALDPEKLDREWKSFAKGGDDDNK